jgi:phytoene dehydrogenase-like protein
VYDTAVVGGQLGGALAAALLAKRGHRVLWIEHDGLGAGYSHNGYLLPYAPFLAAPPRTFPAVEDALIELGLAEYIKRSIKPQTLQVVLRKHRFDLALDDSRRARELNREFGAPAGAKLEASWKATVAMHADTNPFFRHAENLPPTSFWQRWASQRKVAATPALTQPFPFSGDGEVETLLRDLSRFVSFLEKPALLSQTRTVSQILGISGRYQGAREGLRDILCKRLTELGGHFVGRDTTTPTFVESLTFDGQRVSGLRVHGSDADYRASSVIAATDAAALRRLIPEKRRQRKLTEFLDTMSTPAFLFSINWVIRADALPKGMGEMVLMATEDPELTPMLVQVLPARTDAGKEEPGLVTLCAGAFVASSARELGEEHLAKLAERMNTELSRLIPFAQGKRLDASAPYLHAGGMRGSRLMPHPLYAIEGESFLGVTGLPSLGPVKNLYFASREVLPGLGVEGELLAGIQSAQHVQKLLHKRRTLPR